ncbi:hypothetical protein BJX96DRAFT_168167 [Aspergillus floccosus]
MSRSGEFGRKGVFLIDKGRVSVEGMRRLVWPILERSEWLEVHIFYGATGSRTPPCTPKIQGQSVVLSDGQSPYCGACDRKFHVMSKKKALRNCEKCNKSFASATVLRQHKESAFYKPLAELRCVAESCRLTFNTPSALIHYLESGRCPSGWSRQTINTVLHRSDTDRIITTLVMLLDTSITGTALSSSASSFSDIVYTPTEGSEIDTHAGKAFTCPIAFTAHATSPTARYLESGRCQGGKSTLWKIMDYLQNEVFKFEWPGRLLRG